MQLSQIIKVAYNEAYKAKEKSEIPVGAVIFNKTEIISKAHNQCITKNDPIAHAEILALRKASRKLNKIHLNDLMIYTTLEPCDFCSIAISKYRLNTIYFGAYNILNGALENGRKIFNSSKNIYKPNVYGGISSNTSEKLLKQFFSKIRDNN